MQGRPLKLAIFTIVLIGSELLGKSSKAVAENEEVWQRFQTIRKNLFYFFRGKHVHRNDDFDLL